MSKIHEGAIIIDGHSDILASVASGEADLGTQRTSSTALTDIPDEYGLFAQYSLPQWIAGGVTVQACAVYLSDQQIANPLRYGLDMIWRLHQAVADHPQFELVLRAADILRIKHAGKVGLLLTLEGLEPLENEPRLLDIFYKLGLRMAGLTHSRRNMFADGSQWGVRTGGLTSAGREVILRMNQLGIVIDLAHLNQVGYWEVLELSKQPVVVSHGSPHKYYPDNPDSDPNPRYPALDITQGRERLDALARNGGVFGVIFYRQQTLADILDDIEFLLDRVGPDHVALGSDFYGLGNAPADFPDISHLPILTDGLLRRGIPDDAILKILGLNYLRVFQEVWK
jgi:membrane dipeptidase